MEQVRIEVPAETADVRLDRFLASSAAADDDDLGLEAAAVRAALGADVLLYTIDARSDTVSRAKSR